MLLLLAAAGYFGFNLGEAYWRQAKFLNGMKQEARFASSFTDRDITTYLVALADSIGLPDDAVDNLVVERTPQRTIHISTEYEERVEMPMYVRVIRFRPSADGTF